MELVKAAMINWLKLEEAAEYLKIGRSTLYKLAQAGRTPAHKVGYTWRFDAAELDQWLKEGKFAPESANKRKKGNKEAWAKTGYALSLNSQTEELTVGPEKTSVWMDSMSITKNDHSVRIDENNVW